jgi:biopolymer transport protein ExbB/TolQ
MDTVQQLIDIAWEFGGPVVLILGVLSITATAAGPVQAVAVRRRPRRAPPAGARGHRPVVRGQPQAGLCLVAHDASPLSRVVGHAMRGMTHGRENLMLVREDVIRVAQEQLYDLRKYLRGLDFVAQTSPLLGLFGTVLGMIEAFSQLEAAAPPSIPRNWPAASGRRSSPPPSASPSPSPPRSSWPGSRAGSRTSAPSWRRRWPASSPTASPKARCATMDEVTVIPGGLEAHAH